MQACGHKVSADLSLALNTLHAFREHVVPAGRRGIHGEKLKQLEGINPEANPRGLPPASLSRWWPGATLQPKKLSPTFLNVLTSFCPTPHSSTDKQLY